MNARALEPEDDVARLRIPPHSLEAEQAVLGALLQDNAAFDRCGDLLSESDFFSHHHRLIWSAIATLVTALKVADVFTVGERLRDAGHAEIGVGMQYLNAMQSSIMSSAGVRHYATIVREKAVLRSLIAGSDEIATMAFNGGELSAADKLDRAANLFADLQERSVRQPPRRADVLMVHQLDRWNELHEGTIESGISTGIRGIDDVLNGGLQPGRVYTLAARPSVGKSSLAMAILLHTTVELGRAGLLLSMEMEAGECMDRAVANLAGVEYDHLQTGQIDNADWPALSEAAERIMKSPLFIDDQAALTLDQIRGKAVALRREKLGLVVIDYLQLCDYQAKKGQSTADALGHVSKGIKRLAKDLKVPVILLSQLNRAVEQRASPEPGLADLRDSGAIEQDADVVMMLWRARTWSDRQIMGLSFPKNRQGKAARRVALEFHGHVQRWNDSDADITPQAKTATNDKGFE